MSIYDIIVIFMITKIIVIIPFSKKEYILCFINLCLNTSSDELLCIMLQYLWLSFLELEESTCDRDF